jgi:hypothetical protein
MAAGQAHRKGTLYRKLRLDRTLIRFPPPAPGAFNAQGYDASVTRFGQSTDGRSAAALLAQELATSMSTAYGFKWARFTRFCGSKFCPLPATVETVGRYLGFLFRNGKIQGTSVLPYIAAIRTMHIRYGFPSPTDDPVVDSLRRVFSRLTADHVSSRPQSVALPASLGLLVCTRALQKRLPSTAAAIAIGFSLGLRPMTIRGLHA